ncbi:MAG: hypothetical protein KAW14_01970 [Candidatus Aegiribacteria sp.]|nr:hypothetical protein [Candidatus Aegiribacteria sp.]
MKYSIYGEKVIENITEPWERPVEKGSGEVSNGFRVVGQHTYTCVCFKILSYGSRAAEKILLHAVTKYPIVKYKLCIDERTSQSQPYASRQEEINFPIPRLNPGDEAVAQIFCEVSNGIKGSDLLVEHRLTHTEAAVKLDEQL